ncbi:hypothetical protein F5Y09DRAFT_314422 [Xylaria sp. FL1042]|nr:hypothetical protein F5Y09DRAFT_314422 [Xylaria sp. FL1042]
MASPGNPESDTLQKQSQNQSEADVYDLDDPYLMAKMLSRRPKVTGIITCRFSAIPLNEPGSFSTNIGQYGHIIHESKDKLIMRVPPQNIDLINYIRQAWVSKYMTPFTECRFTFDLPRRDGTTTIIIQRLLAKVNKNTENSIASEAKDDPVTTVNDASGTDDRAAVPVPELSVTGEKDSVPRTIRRVCEY